MKISKAGAWVASSVVAVASQAMAQQAVEWKVSEGGNGHWYQWFDTGVSLSNAQSDARAASLNAHLWTVTSEQESMFLFNHVRPPWDCIIGGYRVGANWRWVTNEPWDFAPWCPGQPDYSFENRVSFSWSGGAACFGNVEEPWPHQHYLTLEWEADCNGDGIVDYGQILSGELADTNGNGVPDCCEDGSTCTTSLTVNSGFESGSPLNACASESVSAGNLVASGWQVTTGTVDRIRGGSTCASATQPKFGDYCIDLCGTPASSGAIKQLVPTVPGHKYRCTFWLSGDASAGPAAKKVHAKVGSYIDLTYNFNCSGTGAQNWVVNQFEFTARGANESLEFVADNGVTTGGPMLDAINLVDITTQCVGDLDASGQVDGADIALLLLNFGDCPVGP